MYSDNSRVVLLCLDTKKLYPNLVTRGNRRRQIDLSQVILQGPPMTSFYSYLLISGLNPSFSHEKSSTSCFPLLHTTSHEEAMESSTSCPTSSNSCIADAPPDFSLSTVEQLALGFVVFGVSAIILLQMDILSRHILAPDRLLAKRRQEYSYAVNQCVEYNALMIRQHVGGGKKLYSPKSEEMVEKIDNHEIKGLIDEILDPKKATPVIVAIEQDATDTNPDIYYLFMAFPGDEGTSTPAKPVMYRRVRVPLVAFCEEMANAFESQMTSTAFCFIADASCGLGTDMLTSVVESCDTGVVSRQCFVHREAIYY